MPMETKKMSKRTFWMDTLLFLSAIDGFVSPATYEPRKQTLFGYNKMLVIVNQVSIVIFCFSSRVPVLV